MNKSVVKTNVEGRHMVWGSTVKDAVNSCPSVASARYNNGKIGDRNDGRRSPPPWLQ